MLAAPRLYQLSDASCNRGARCHHARSETQAPTLSLSTCRNQAGPRGVAYGDIAIGSSSTLGAGASSSAATYPALLRAYLVATFPDLAIAVHNKGVNGETTAQTLARFESDVVALQADLVIWQVGTNDALRDILFSEVAQVIESGLLRLKQRQIAVALLDLQYLGGGSDSKLALYQADLERLTERLQVPRIPCWRLMKSAVESGEYTLTDLVSSDGLHTTDIPYQQTAADTARLIAQQCAVTKH